jgi:hypothetical protein
VQQLLEGSDLGGGLAQAGLARRHLLLDESGEVLAQGLGTEG